MSKKIIFKKKVEHKKNITQDIITLSNTNSCELINSVYVNGNEKVKKEILQKLQSYKSQDKKKAKYNKEKFITYDELLEKLVISKMLCFYCRSQMKLIYTILRDPTQWTIDRIDNKLGHNSTNIVIACLKCNLERRTRDDKKFLMGKQMKIKKII